MPTVGQKEEVSSGWEEPSPESIRRRMEIDDGTAAWGDPGKHSASYEFLEESTCESKIQASHSAIKLSVQVNTAVDQSTCGTGLASQVKRRWVNPLSTTPTQHTAPSILLLSLCTSSHRTKPAPLVSLLDYFYFWRQFI